MRTIGVFTFMIPVGLASAIATLTGNMVGAGKPDMAMRYYYIAIGLGIVISLITVGFLVGARDMIAAFYTDNPNVAA